MNLPNVDFFAEANHQEKPRCDTLFGINDGVEEGDIKGCAYTKQGYCESISTASYAWKTSKGREVY